MAIKLVPAELEVMMELGANVPERVESERQVPEIAKHPAVVLKPTLEVEVAWPLMFKPLTVVVPKPPRATSSAEVEVVAVPATVVVEM